MATDTIPTAVGTPYAGFARTASRLINKWGKTASASITRTTLGAYNPTTGRTASGSPTVYPCVTVQSQWNFKRQPTRPVQEGTQRFLFSAQDMVIIPNGTIDILTWNGARFRFISGQIIAPGGIPLLFDMECQGMPTNGSVPNEIFPFQMRVADAGGDVLADALGNNIIPG